MYLHKNTDIECIPGAQKKVLSGVHNLGLKSNTYIIAIWMVSASVYEDAYCIMTKVYHPSPSINIDSIVHWVFVRRTKLACSH